MAIEQRKRTRSDRVAALEMPPGLFGRMLASLQQPRVWIRVGLCTLAALALWGVTAAWEPPMAFRTGYVPARDVLARVPFEQDDPDATHQAQRKARSLALAVYRQDPVELDQLRASLQIALDKVIASETLDQLGIEQWKRFELPRVEGTAEPTLEERKQAFLELKQAVSAEGDLERHKEAVEAALAPFEKLGLLDASRLPPEDTANQERIYVFPEGKNDSPREVQISDVLIASATPAIRKALGEKIDSEEVADRIFAWLKPELPSTLTLDPEATKAEKDRAAAAVEPQKKSFEPGHVLARGWHDGRPGPPIDEATWKLLRLEHEAFLSGRPVTAKLFRSLAALGMFCALYTVCGFYLVQREPALVGKLSRFFTLLCLVVVTAALCKFLAHDAWRAELIPLLLFGMTAAIAYSQEIGLLLAAAMTLVVVVSIGQGLAGAVVLAAAATGAILMLRRVRSRSKLLLVGACAGLVALLTTLGVGTLESQPLAGSLLFDAARSAVWAVIAGSLMTCLLPFIERWFGVQTEISLIELGDPAHPLLQELVRRAPGTYNHSITVASLAEAAAERIGARGLLVRVGAYYHDIGKMLKPGYFIENQSQGDNRHESLVPAMSTLVIIAHVKDGADLGRQHRLPESVIDFVQQHHGTTLVEYFYRRASAQKEADPNGSEVDESTFRYPGPKPQSKEAGILMLADSVESASRVLVEPAPSRIESLVHEIAMKRLMDGQFDECGLTLKEVNAVKESLVKSLTAVYHGRVKYPDQQTA